MNATYCKTHGEYRFAYDGRVECMDCTRARTALNHARNRAKRITQMTAYDKANPRKR